MATATETRETNDTLTAREMLLWLDGYLTAVGENEIDSEGVELLRQKLALVRG